MAPYIRGELVYRSFNAPVADLSHIDSFQPDPVFGFRTQFYQYPAVPSVCRECESFDSASGGGCDFRLDVIVGQVHRIISDACLFASFVYARTVAFVRLLLVTGSGFQLSVRCHYSKSSQSPFMDMAEACHIFEGRLVACLPPRILVVRAHFHHAERHPRARGDHPS